MSEVVAGLGTEVEHVVVAERLPGDARAFRDASPNGAVTTAPIDRSGDLGVATPLVALLAGLRTVEEGERFDWLVPSLHTVIGARFEAKSTESCEDLDAALHGAASATDPGTALRVRDAWRSHGDQVAQGAFVSLQQYLHEAPARYRLEGQRCTSCGRILFPPREGCPDCPDARLVVEPLSGRGTVYARTTIARGGAPTEFAPQQEAVGTYPVAVVELEEGPRVAAQLTGSGAARLEIGSPVLAVFRLLYVQAGVARYGFKFTGAMD
ncbi:MAG: Zn-ribbon domain-containing OB-fold protein [Euryarchaeota archaeon]|nr:Zn-ribbon domain-containing OB-fold protein [Euryarchaeota archaeon]